MRTTFAQFHIEHKKKMYGVLITIQDVTQNVTRCNVRVINAQNETLLSEARSGRQIVSQWNAKEILKDALEANGMYKRRNKKVNPNEQ